MATVYLGNGTYEIHLDSGKIVELTESELINIVDVIKTLPEDKNPLTLPLTA